MVTSRQDGRLFLASRSIVILAVIACIVSVARADDPPESYVKLQQKFRAAYDKADYDKALEIAGKMHDARPDDVAAIYNIACLHCLKGEKSKAYEWLEKAVDTGYDDAYHLQTDSDFRTLRGEDRFRKIVRRVRAHDRGDPEARLPGKPSREKDEDRDEKNEDDDAEAPAKPGPGRQDMDESERIEKVQALTQKLIEASEEKDYEEALKLALEAKKLADGTDQVRFKALTHYNVACMYSLNKEKDKSLEYLKKAVELGGFGNDFAEQIENDSDFDHVRDDPRFAKILAVARGGTGGKKSGFIWTVTPPKGAAAKKAAPLLVVLHGHGGNMREATQQWQSAAQKMGAILLAPQGTNQIGEGKYEWGRNLDDVEENLLDAINKVMDEHKVDHSRVVLAGFSQGGLIAWTLGLRNPDTFRGLIPVCGRCDAPSESDTDEEALAKLRIYIMIGADDDEALLKSNRDAEKRFKKLGAKVKLKVFDGVGHAYPESAEEEELKALEFVLGN